MKAKRKVAGTLFAYILLILCVFTGCKKEDVNTTDESKKNEVDKVVSFKKVNKVNNASEEAGVNKPDKKPVSYNFEGVLNENQSIISFGVLDDNKTIYLNVLEFLYDKTRNTYLMSLEEKDGTWNVVNKYKIKLAQDEYANEYLSEGFPSGDGKTYTYIVTAMIRENKNTWAFQKKTYMAKIEDGEMTPGKVVSIENMNNGLSVASEYGIDKDNCEINILGVIGNTIYLTICSGGPTNARLKNEISEGEEASKQYVYHYATMDVNTKNLTILKGLTEFERFTDLGGLDTDDNFLLHGAIYQNEKGNIELLYLYKDTSEETWEVTYEYDLNKKEMTEISNRKVQNLIFSEEYEDYNFDNISFCGLGNNGKDMFYMLYGKRNAVFCSLSIDVVK